MDNLPNVLRAMDGKQILFKASRNAEQNSSVLLALVDANYKFLYVDVGTNGRVSDRGVFRKSLLAKAIANNCLHFPEKTSTSWSYNACTIYNCCKKSGDGPVG